MTDMKDTELVKLAKEMANSIGSPWGEGATYDTIFPKLKPSVKVSKDPETYSHLDDGDYEIFVNDLLALIKRETDKARSDELLKLYNENYQHLDSTPVCNAIKRRLAQIKQQQTNGGSE